MHYLGVNYEAHNVSLEFVEEIATLPWRNNNKRSRCSTAILNWYQINAFNTLRPSQNGRHFPDDIFIFIFLNENVWILVKISMKFVPNGPINNI